MKKMFLVSFTASTLLFNCAGNRSEESAAADSAAYAYDSIAWADSTAVGSVDYDSIGDDLGNFPVVIQQPILIDSPVNQPASAPEEKSNVVETLQPAQANDEPTEDKSPEVFQSREQFFDASPRKIYYLRQKRGAFENEPFDIKIVLWDNENRRVRADKNYKIVISIQRMDVSREQTQSKQQWEKRDTIIMKQGEGEVVYRFVPSESGIYAVMCNHPEMQPAEWKMNVMSKMRKVGYSIPKSNSPFMLASYPILQSSAYILVSTQAEKVPLADGEDFADIEFLLVDPDELIQKDSVRVVIENSKGTLSKKSLYVNKDYFVNTRLTSSSQGSVTLRFQCTDPQVKPNMETVKINFAVAIDHFELSLSPPKINLFDLCQVIICLKNKKDITVATDRIMPGSFEIVKGSGRFASDTLKIVSGRMQAQIHFQPTTAGMMTIRAHVPGLSSQTKEMVVTWPLLLISLSVAFGLIGSFAANKRRSTKWITIFSGAITGLALYWVLVFCSSLLVSPVTQAVALNPITAIVIGMAGGFAGVEVLRFMLKRIFGIEV